MCRFVFARGRCELSDFDGGTERDVEVCREGPEEGSGALQCIAVIGDLFSPSNFVVTGCFPIYAQKATYV